MVNILKYYFNLVRDFIFTWAYPASMLGAIFFSIGSSIQMDPVTAIATRPFSIVVNLYIGICGTLSLFYWYNIDIPLLGTIILPNRNVIKRSVNYDGTNDAKDAAIAKALAQAPPLGKI